MVQVMIGNIKRTLSAIAGIPDHARIWYLNCLVDDRDKTIERMANDLISTRRWLQESGERCASLARERDALSAELVGMSKQRDAIVDALQKQLASALDTIDKLTRWRKQSEEPCPFSDSTVVMCITKNQFGCLRDACDLEPGDQWRHVPESLQALRESEGGDGK